MRVSQVAGPLHHNVLVADCLSSLNFGAVMDRQTGIQTESNAQEPIVPNTGVLKNVVSGASPQIHETDPDSGSLIQSVSIPI